MNVKPIAVEIFTTSHRILGRVAAGSGGLYSHLNLPTQSYTEIHSGYLSRLHEPGKIPTEHSKLWITKREIVAVLLNARGDIGSIGASRRGYSSRVLQTIRVVLGGYELTGQISSAGSFNYGSMLFEGDALFIPLYDAELKAVLFPSVQADAQALLFNREKVDAIATIKDAK